MTAPTETDALHAGGGVDLPQPYALDWPEEGLTKGAGALALWRLHQYDTGAEPLYTAEQVREHTATLRQRYTELEANFHACRRDAERWQFVRPHLEVHHDWEEGTTRRYSWVTFKRENLPVPPDPHYPTADAAIDACMSNEAPNG